MLNIPRRENQEIKLLLFKDEKVSLYSTRLGRDRDGGRLFGNTDEATVMFSS